MENLNINLTQHKPSGFLNIDLTAPLGPPPVPPEFDVPQTPKSLDIPTHKSINAPVLNPETQTLTSLQKLQKEDKTFRDRLRELKVTNEEVSILCEDLEKMGEAGSTIPDFASKLGLLASELDELRKRFPAIERSMHVAKGLRKKMLGELTLSHAVRNPAAMKELLNNDFFSKDFLSDEEESEMERLKQSLDRRAEEILLEKGITPCQYTQVTYVTGDLDLKTYETPADLRQYQELGYLDARAILESLNAGNQPSQKDTTLPSRPIGGHGLQNQVLGSGK